MKKLNLIKAEKGTIKAEILDDADGEIGYIKDVAEQGCSGGNCAGLIYYTDTEAFYNKYADEIDEILLDMEEMSGKPYDITGNMKRLKQSNLRNFLALLAYEVKAQEIMQELDPEN